MNPTSLVVVLSIAASLTSATVFAQSYAPGAKPSADDESGEREGSSRNGAGDARGGNDDHHGFMFRGTLGFGGGSVGVSSNSSSGDGSFGGSNGLASFAIGGAVAPNFALGIESFAVSFLEPKLTISGQEYATKSGTKLSTAGLGLLGTYYFMPANIYLSGTFGMATTSLEYTSSSGQIKKNESDRGIGGNIKVGKEWPVAHDWNLGVAAHYIFASVPDSASTSTTLTTSAFGLAFSATYF